MVAWSMEIKYNIGIDTKDNKRNTGQLSGGIVSDTKYLSVTRLSRIGIFKSKFSNPII